MFKKPIYIFLILSLALFATMPARGRVAARELDPHVLHMAYTAYKNAQTKGVVKKEILTIVDYSMASTKPRMWVIDMKRNKILFHTHVSHGSGSGENFATRFSNTHGSRMSSLGIFVTANIYHGQHGTSLNLRGMQKKYNSNALARRIVVHEAQYVDQSIINKIGRLGRSFGCLALNKKVAKNIMHTIKDGSVIFCYYPDKNWLKAPTTLSF